MTDFISNNPVANFSHGFLYPYRAWRFIGRHPRLYKFVLVPFLINVGLFYLIVSLGLRFFQELVVHHIPQGEAWYWPLLYYTLWVVAVLVTMVLVFFSFTAIGNLIASPFNDLLAERTDEILTGRKSEEPFALRKALGDALRTLLDECRKIGLFTAVMALLLLLNLIPVLGSLLYSGLSILFTIFFLAVEYTGYIFSLKQGAFKDQRRFIFGRKFLLFGFGTGVLCLLAIPLVQFFCIPLGVVGAVQLFHDCGGEAVLARQPQASLPEQGN